MDKVVQKKAIYYARVSTRDQADEGYSLPSQEKLLTNYVETRGMKVVRGFSVSESARGKQERKVFEEVISYLAKHTEVKVLVAEKTDRISRNFKDATKIDDWLNEDDTRELHLVKQNLVLHKNSRSQDKLMWDIQIALAKNYSNNLSEEARKGMLEKALQGWYPGNKKLGYHLVVENGKKIWQINTKSTDSYFVRRAFELYDNPSTTLRLVRDTLIDEGFHVTKKKLSINEVHSILHDVFYYGDFVWDGKNYVGKHEPLISKELFMRVQDKLHRKVTSGKYKKRNYLFGTSLFICDECGRAITAEEQKGKNYYHCTRFNTNCTQHKYVREEAIEKQILELLDSLVVPNLRLQNWILDALKENHVFESDYHHDVISELDKEFVTVTDALDKVYEDHVSKLISKEEYLRYKDKYSKRLEKIVDAKGKHMRANINYQQLGINIFEISQKGRQLYENKATMTEKREVLNFVFSNLKLRDGNVVPVYQNGFEIIAKHAKNNTWLGNRDSNPNYRIQSAASYH